MRPAYHLAQVNIGITREPLDSVRLRGFMDMLDPVNALADAAPGFVWRLQTEDGNATAVRAFPEYDVDGLLIINMSVWDSFDALAAFVYRSDHLEIMRRRRDWFERMPAAFLALWWIPAGQIPTTADAEVRIAALRADGPSPFSFTFREHFPAPTDGEARHEDDRWGCPAG